MSQITMNKAINLKELFEWQPQNTVFHQHNSDSYRSIYGLVMKRLCKSVMKDKAQVKDEVQTGGSIM